MNGASASCSLRSAFSYCVRQVCSYDYHHYLCLLELPPPMRKVAFALHAFNVETARAVDVASDPRIGLMRLIWWQESTQSPVISENKISKGWLKQSVDARMNVARRELEKYAEDTVSTILYMTLQAGGIIIRSTAADHAASHIGKASGLLWLLKSLPYYASRNHNFSYIPAKVGYRSEICLDSPEHLCDAVFDMASIANIQLQKAREPAGTVPAEARPLLLQVVPAQVLLDSLSQVQFDVFDPRLSRGVLGIRHLWYQLKLNWYSRRGKY
ncbi:hypothetical protein ACB092_10G061300 [Castanea dentata]